MFAPHLLKIVKTISRTAFFTAEYHLLQRFPAEGRTILVAIFGVQAVLWITDIVMLVSRSARDYCNG